MNKMFRGAVRWVGLWLLAVPALMPLYAEEPVPLLPVTFQVNDADEKDKVLPGVAIGGARTPAGAYEWTGTTDASGQLRVPLAAGTWYVTYRLKDYVSVERTETVIRETNQLVTTTLSISIEASGPSDQRRIRIILNWGSRTDQVRDADSHATCVCQAPNAHVFYQNRQHVQMEHGLDLDLDDTDWGGPETITLRDPPPGSYAYWVHNYSGPPAVLAKADVVVRVLFGDTAAGEFRVPPDAKGRTWRPFKEIVVDALLEPKLVPFSTQELADQAALVPLWEDPARPDTQSGASKAWRWFFWIAVLWIVYRAIRRKKQS